MARITNSSLWNERWFRRGGIVPHEGRIQQGRLRIPSQIGFTFNVGTSMKSNSFLIAFLAIFAIGSEAFGNDLFRRVAEMVNDERQQVGLPRLTYNQKLEQAALLTGLDFMYQAI